MPHTPLIAGARCARQGVCVCDASAAEKRRFRAVPGEGKPFTRQKWRAVMLGGCCLCVTMPYCQRLGLGFEAVEWVKRCRRASRMRGEGVCVGVAGVYSVMLGRVGDRHARRWAKRQGRGLGMGWRKGGEGVGFLTPPTPRNARPVRGVGVALIKYGPSRGQKRL